MASDLATNISSFPQTYLGLPLSPHKLPPSAFQPVIDRCDIYLAGWCALLLSRGGKLVLLSAVLDSLPTYFMLCFSLPFQVIEAIDKRRRSFFWSNDETCSGAKCLVAWDKVCTPRGAGGLGVKNLRAQNFCLLLKFAYKFLHSTNLPWKDWVLHHSPLHIGHGKNSSFLAKTIFKHLQSLREISQCTVGDGCSTFFWLDRWLKPEPLALAHPALFSHHKNPNAMVATIMQDGIELALRNRLTTTAVAELASLNSLLQECALSQVPDTRCLLNGAPFSTCGAYAALSDQLTEPMLAEIWDSRVPKKVMIFGWLFYLDRLNTRKNLHKKHILDTEACPRCNHPVEDREHLFFSCPAARRIWRATAIRPLSTPIGDFFTTPLPASLPTSVRPFMLLLILWKIWDARNKKVFQDLEIDASDSIRAILDDLIIWSHRLKSETLMGHAGLWREFLSSQLL